VASNLASKGCHLILNYTSQSSLSRTEQLAESLEQEHHVNTHIVQADLGSQSGPAHSSKMANNHFAHPKTGKLHIDIMINNAGVANNKSIEDCTVEDFSWHYNINVRGPLLLTQTALPYLPTDRSGRIVNISSVSSSLGFVGQSVYGGTKAALEAMTRTWARELSERATVNAVNPGPVATDMHHDSSPEWIAMLKPSLRTRRCGARERVWIPKRLVGGMRMRRKSLGLWGCCALSSLVGVQEALSVQMGA
jgi:NAD(P)-dependent dehydrogenase (short-subunit alcohol dehydrogenase family)